MILDYYWIDGLVFQQAVLIVISELGGAFWVDSHHFQLRPSSSYPISIIFSSPTPAHIIQLTVEMQSYQLHIVSQHLKRRHPYLQPPFKARYDPTQVHKSVFDRTIPKLIEILLTEDLASNRYTSAFIILNELASDQAEKSNMIRLGVVGIAAAYMHCKVVSIRREATLLLGLLLSTVSGLQKMSINEAITGIKKLLFDEELEVRNAISWTLCRIVLSRTGTEILCKNSITPTIIESFLKYSGTKEKKQQYFILYLLQAFKHLLAYDDGIKSCLNTGLTKRLRELTETTGVYSDFNNSMIHYLALGALSNLAMNLEGKEECVKEEVIASAEKYLESQVPEEVANAVTLIMFTSINLIGKKQCIYNKEGQVDTKIIVKLVKLLGPTKTPPKEGAPEVCKVDETVKGDVKETLKIIGQEEDGFLAIAEYMSREADIAHIESIFGASIIVPLAKLLPKVTQIPDAPTFPSNKINDYKAYAKIICHFLTKSPEAIQIGLNQCVDLIIKLAFFLCYRGDKALQEGVAKSIEKLATAHEYSKKIFKDLVVKYGEIEHKISKTTVNNEIARYPQLKALVA